MKIGILGGTFDPIHNGHLMLARHARDVLGMDEVWFMPNGNPPHKTSDSIETNTKHRLAMIQKAINDDTGFVIQSYEIKRKETNYSYLTMEQFKEMYAGYEFYFIIGADSLYAIESWKHPERLMKTCTILAACREDKNQDDMQKQIAYLKEKYDADIRLMNTEAIDISSTEIRSCVKERGSIEHLVPAAVCEYIKENGLYEE